MDSTNPTDSSRTVPSSSSNNETNSPGLRSEGNATTVPSGPNMQQQQHREGARSSPPAAQISPVSEFSRQQQPGSFPQHPYGQHGPPPPGWNPHDPQFAYGHPGGPRGMPYGPPMYGGYPPPPTVAHPPQPFMGGPPPPGHYPPGPTPYDSRRGPGPGGQPPPYGYMQPGYPPGYPGQYPTGPPPVYHPHPHALMGPYSGPPPSIHDKDGALSPPHHMQQIQMPHTHGKGSFTSNVGAPISPSPNHDPSASPEQQAYGEALYKTELCKSFSETGYCRYGLKCRFAHGLVDLRLVQRHKKYKTQLCKNFTRDGTCPYGPRCRFIHNQMTQDQDELPGLGAVQSVEQVRGLVATGSAPGLIVLSGPTANGAAQVQMQRGANGPLEGQNAGETSHTTSPYPSEPSVASTSAPSSRTNSLSVPGSSRNISSPSTTGGSIIHIGLREPSRSLMQPQQNRTSLSASPPSSQQPQHSPNYPSHYQQVQSGPSTSTTIPSVVSVAVPSISPSLGPRTLLPESGEDPVATLFPSASVSRSPIIGPSPSNAGGVNGGSGGAQPSKGSSSPFFSPGGSNQGGLGLLPGLSLEPAAVTGAATGDDLLASSRPRSLSASSMLRSHADPLAPGSAGGSGRGAIMSHSPPIGSTRLSISGPNGMPSTLTLPSSAVSGVRSPHSSAPGGPRLSISGQGGVNGSVEHADGDGESSLFSSPMMLSASPSHSPQTQSQQSQQKPDLLELGPNAFAKEQ